MTNSNDTSTPTMSAETVPSEEFVLVPREPTREMKEAGARHNGGLYPISLYRAMLAAAPRTILSQHQAIYDEWLKGALSKAAPASVNEYAANYYFAGDGGDHTPTEGERAMIEDAINGYIADAALTLSASHLAKEGGEAGGDYVLMPRRVDYGMVERRFDTRDWEGEDYRSVQREYEKWTALGVPASHPQPSPALAKGGDAVREAEEIADKWRDLALQFDAHRIQALSWLKAMVADAETHKAGASGFLASPPLSGEKVLAERLAALSTPTEGPASAEDWLRGMARMSSYPVEICQKFEDLADLIMERHNATA